MIVLHNIDYCMQESVEIIFPLRWSCSIYLDETAVVYISLVSLKKISLKPDPGYGKLQIVLDFPPKKWSCWSETI